MFLHLGEKFCWQIFDSNVLENMFFDSQSPKSISKTAYYEKKQTFPRFQPLGENLCRWNIRFKRSPKYVFGLPKA